MTDIECVVDAKAQLGESTYWDPTTEALWWIDIYQKAIHRFDPVSRQTETHIAPELLGCIAVRERGGLVLTMASGFYFFDSTTGHFDKITDPEESLPDNRFNDGKTDRQGRFWSGSMFEAPGKPVVKNASLYRMDADLSVHRIVEGIGCSNGLAWSPDSRTMYYTDSHGPVVWAWDFDPLTGDVENRRPYFDLSEMGGGVVDGSTVDAEGGYWATIPFQGKVLRFDPAGKLVRTIELPTDLPTCCEFGGRDLDTLYVTTAIYNRTPDQLAGQQNPGGLFALDVGVKGLPLVPFKG
ncbi:SMP-30/gluconolactonase/LRE family protein [Kaistia terrae]|uniref:SMP-30/gluconolactonase/LRE family protein n=1 Tax=Kaistia terrae TaxID=537017 RepID=A0ABW0PT35_9HYPH|nr:SMP-30/gluconolactonase/LRE family protein [Kaistia terrae]MCX5577292.1 SMP-30/gluconolactonase/LRE family protein [Kaistia terrae]